MHWLLPKGQPARGTKGSKQLLTPRRQHKAFMRS